MILLDYIKELDPNEPVYIGCKSAKGGGNGSGFVFIGRACDIPIEQFGERLIRETYPHETDVPGTTIIISGLERGPFWTWKECMEGRA